jgi:hypothetical protein
MLTCVTLTGADDSVDPKELAAISRQYPFVEWGILVNARGGSTHFPSGGWMARLMQEVAEAHPHTVALSLHVCGKLLRSILRHGDFPVGASIDIGEFSRMQLNFHGEAIADTQLGRDQAVHNVASVQAVTGIREVIVQLDGVNDWLLDALTERGIQASGLYDRSHGAGVKPDAWPAPNPAWRVGYAGGLGPDGLHEDLAAIAAAASGKQVWIDMETHLFADRRFNLEKCQRVLELCRSFTIPF